MPHDLRNAGLESFGDDMLQTLGLFVDLAPGVAESIDEKGLEKSVVTEHLEGHFPPSFGQLDAAIGRMFDESEMSEPSYHFGHRRRFDLETARESLGAHLADLPAEQEDLLEVVLLGLRQIGPLIIRQIRLRRMCHIFRLT
jgi:hypothetical protein